MKRFSFNLQKVLKLRKFKEEEAKIALGQAISSLTIIENKIKDNAVKHHQASTERFTDTQQSLRNRRRRQNWLSKKNAPFTLRLPKN